MLKALSNYARLLIQDEAKARSQLSTPVLLWELPPESPGDRVLFTRVEIQKKPRAQEPVVLELRQAANKVSGQAIGITLGRTNVNDLVLEDQSVSRFHAYFRTQNAQWTLSDAASRNGTWVGTNRLTPHKPEPIADRQRLRFGEVNVQFLLPESFIAHLKRAISSH